MEESKINRYYSQYVKEIKKLCFDTNESELFINDQSNEVRDTFALVKQGWDSRSSSPAETTKKRRHLRESKHSNPCEHL